MQTEGSTNPREQRDDISVAAHSHGQTLKEARYSSNALRRIIAHLPYLVQWLSIIGDRYLKNKTLQP